MRGAGAVLAVTAAALLAGCADPVSRRVAAGDPFAPSGRPAAGEAVDGLTVGHRLMDAGEHELALDAFYRAAGERGLDADVLSALGSANLRLGRLGQAERLLRRAVQEDAAFAAAWNNLGVVLMEKGETAEAREVFRRAFGLDNGASPLIRENLRLALAKTENPAYDAPNKEAFALVRRGPGDYRLTASP